jgi:hypothetical protein
LPNEALQQTAETEIDSPGLGVATVGGVAEPGHSVGKSLTAIRRSAVGLTCIACGFAGRFAFRIYCPPVTRLEDFDQSLVLAPFFAAGWLLLSIPAIKTMYGPKELDLRDLGTWVLMSVGAFAFLWLVFLA